MVLTGVAELCIIYHLINNLILINRNPHYCVLIKWITNGWKLFIKFFDNLLAVQRLPDGCLLSNHNKSQNNIYLKSKLKLSGNLY